MIRCALFVLFVSSLAVAQEDAASSKKPLTISLNGVRDARGEIVIAIYTRDEGFPEKGWLKAVRVPAQKGKTTATVDLPPGRYAISAYHDANGDGKMNSGLLGPTEGYAFGNDARDTFGPPAFQKCFMDLTPDRPVELKTSY